MNKTKMLITFDLPNFYIEKIKSVSPKINVVKSTNYDEILRLVKTADVLIPRIFSPEIFLAAKQLKWIQTCGVGVDHFLFPEVVKSEVIFSNAKGVSKIPISEHVIGIMLCFSRRLNYYIKSQKQKKWKENPDVLLQQFEELNGKTVGIVGFGNIGSYLATKIKCLEMRVIVTTKNQSDASSEYVDKFFGMYELEKMLSEADFVILTVPLTSETRNLIGKKQLKKMKKTSYLINVCRGKIIDEKKLIKALKEGWIAGAGLDTFESEPLSSNSELWELENVIITPHVAGLTRNYWDRVIEIICENLTLFLENKPLKNVINKKIGY
ncbi:MAG: D-2-hydroxyacid dehydrogenase [Clostridiales bacterium]|nr:D-2-hydroxyacid dehydrogenase [Clostridiales bacterium]